MELRISTHPVPGLTFEDAVAVAPDGTAAVLVDGAGLPAELRGGCRHSVQWYAGTLAQAMLARLTARTGTPREALADAIADVLAAHGPHCRPEQGSPSSTLAAWRVVEAELEYVVLSDSSLFLRRTDGSVVEVVDEAVDLLTGPRRAEAFAALTAEGMAPEQARLEAHRQTTERLRNVEGGFWCCHVEPAAAVHAQTGSVPLAELDAVVLASDGATRLVRPFGVLSAQDFVARCLARSHDELAAELRATEQERVAVTRRVAVKPHDDATIVAAPLRATAPIRGAVPFRAVVPHGAVGGAGPATATTAEPLPGAPSHLVRRARSADVPAVVALLLADQVRRGREGTPDDPTYRTAFDEIDADPGELLAVIVDAGDAVVGMFQLSLLPGLARRGSKRCQIEAVRVAAGLRGSGIGTAAMRWAIAWARAQGCSLVQLTSDKTRADAHRFYARLGFVASHEGLKLTLDT